MLVLSRKEAEEIVIKLPTGEHIIVRVQRISGGIVKIGIDAPKNIAIVRRELLDCEA